MTALGKTIKRTYSISYLSSLLVVVGYLTCTTLAWVQFPMLYSPMRNWLSDLGNPKINPGGAVLYNLGVGLTAGLLLVFFLGLSRCRLKGSRVQAIMLILTIVFGGVGAFGMLMSALYPISQPAAHSAWCMVLYIAVGTGFAFSVAAFRYHAGFSRWVLVLGAIAALVDLGVSVLFASVFVAEWVNVLLLLGYCLLLGVATQRLRPGVASEPAGTAST